MVPRRLPRILLPLLLIAGSSGAAHAGGDNPLPGTIAKIRQSIVAIGTVLPVRRPPALFRGTGVVIMDGRYVLTNDHVIPRELDVEKREYVAVFTGLARQAEARQATLVARDEVHDLAILRFEGAPLRAARLSERPRASEGERFAFTGFPIGTVLGLYPVTHEAMISAIAPVVIPVSAGQQLSSQVLRTLRAPYNVYQLDATAFPGNSGSPLYDPASGEVVGILNKVVATRGKESMLSEPSGITFAVPIEHARELIRRVREQR